MAKQPSLAVPKTTISHYMNYGKSNYHDFEKLII